MPNYKLKLFNGRKEKEFLLSFTNSFIWIDKYKKEKTIVGALKLEKWVWSLSYKNYLVSSVFVQSIYMWL